MTKDAAHTEAEMTAHTDPVHDAYVACLKADILAKDAAIHARNLRIHEQHRSLTEKNTVIASMQAQLDVARDKAKKARDLAEASCSDALDWESRYHEAARQRDAFMAENDALRKQRDDALAMLAKVREVVR